MKAERLIANDYPELMDFLNRAFEFDPETNGFLTFLPKLYRREYSPCPFQLAVREDGRIRAAAGIYPVTLHVGSHNLRCAAIGNVAVDQHCRGKGLMSFLMSEAVRDCAAQGYDLAGLGGQRQRYAQFGFEPAGTDYVFSITKTNIRHCFGKEAEPELSVCEVKQSDAQFLSAIGSLHNSQFYHAERDSNRLYDLLCSWSYRPWVLLHHGTAVGYFLKKENEIRELVLEQPQEFDSAIRTMVKAFGDLSLVLPLHERQLLIAANRIAEEYQTEHWEKFLVYRFAAVLGAMLELKAQEEPLNDGELAVCIHGISGDEHIGISVRNQTPHVRAVPGTEPFRADLTLSYREAMECFFSEFSEARRALSPALHRWFPLSLSMRMADHT